MRLFFGNMAVFVLLAIIAFFPCGAIAGLPEPIGASVWIDVERESDVTSFKGYRLPWRGEGMGVAIRPFEVATATHVVIGAKKITLTTAAGQTIFARIESIDEQIDIAILHIERPLRHFAVIRPNAVALGERVSVVGQRRSDEAPKVSSGIVQTTHYISHNVPVSLIFSGIKGEKGMSGGGLFDIAGDLVGIVIRIDATLGYLSALPITALCTHFSRCATSRR